MSALIYIVRRSLINRLKNRLRRPLTYVSVIFIILYVWMLFGSFGTIFENFTVTGEEAYVLLLSFFIVWTIPMSFLSYARKRGLAFKHSDVHFVFSAPISPKLILLYAHMKMLPASLLINLIVTIGGTIWFDISPLKMLLFFLVVFLIENILEASLMLLIFGSESLGEKGSKGIRGLIWACVIFMILLLISQIFTQPFGWQMVADTLAHPLLQLIPVIGWNIAFIRLLLLGPDTINLICAALYLIAAVAAPIAAWRMKCTGEYFEDAMTFADEYEETLKRKKRGTMEGSARKKKFKKAQVVYRGGGAKAIFYRQLLEYKKSRFFLLNYNSFILLGISIIAAAAVVLGIFSFDDMGLGEAAVFILPGISAYMTFIFSGVTPKWSAELKNPYTFLLPDTPFRKLWYSTLLEHVKALMDGAFLCVPLGIVMGLTPVQILLCILIYACLQANRLYISMVCDGILSPLFGNFGLSLIRMSGQGIIMVLGIIGAVVGTVLLGPEAGFLILIAIAVVFSLLLALLGSILFGKMESLENY